MNDTHVTIVGNALHEPEWRKTSSGVMVTTFKIASTSRRIDRASGQWVDGNSLRVRVNCWRTLASNVKNSVTRGDPLIVTGRLFTRDWMDDKGNKRTLFELDARAVGHDLSRGRVVFERDKAKSSTSEIEDAESEQRVGGELTEPVPDDEAPTQFNNTPFDAVFSRPMDPPPINPADEDDQDPVAVLRETGFTADPVDPVPADPGGPGAAPDELSPVAATGTEFANPHESTAFESAPSGEPAEPVEEPSSGRRRGLRRSKIPA